MQWHTVSSDSLLSYWTYKVHNSRNAYYSDKDPEKASCYYPINHSSACPMVYACGQTIQIISLFLLLPISQVRASNFPGVHAYTCFITIQSRSRSLHFKAEVCISRLNASLQAGGASPSSKAHLNVAFVCLNLEATRGPPSQKLCLCNTNLYSPSMLISLWFCLANIL